MKKFITENTKRFFKGLLFENNEVSRTSVMMVSSLTLAWIFYGWALAHPEYSLAVQIISSCTTIITGIVGVKIGQVAVRDTIDGVFNSQRGQRPSMQIKNPNVEKEGMDINAKSQILQNRTDNSI